MNKQELLKLVTLLFEKEFIFDRGDSSCFIIKESLFLNSIKYHRNSIVKLMIKYGFKFYKYDYFDYNIRPIVVCLQNKNLKMFKYLLRCYKEQELKYILRDMNLYDHNNHIRPLYNINKKLYYRLFTQFPDDLKKHVIDGHKFIPYEITCYTRNCVYSTYLKQYFCDDLAKYISKLC